MRSDELTRSRARNVQYALAMYNSLQVAAEAHDKLWILSQNTNWVHSQMVLFGLCRSQHRG